MPNLGSGLPSLQVSGAERWGPVGVLPSKEGCLCPTLRAEVGLFTPLGAPIRYVCFPSNCGGVWGARHTTVMHYRIHFHNS